METKDICKSLCQLDKISFVSLVNKEFPENRVLEKRFNTEKNGMRSPFEIAEGIYVETNLNTQTKIEMIRIIFSHFNIDLQDSSFKLNDEKNE